MGRAGAAAAVIAVGGAGSGALAQVSHYVGTPIPPELVPPMLPPDGTHGMDWSTHDSGGRSHDSGSGLTLDGTLGQADAGILTAGAIELAGGYWAIGAEAPPCYANCDSSTNTPILNVADFTCFLQKFSSGNAYANCDSSTVVPVLNVADFTCFLQKYSAGCP